MKTRARFFFIVTLLLLPPLLGEAATLRIDCDAGDTIEDALTRVKPADTIVIGGTCNENVAIWQEVARVTLDGQGRATINGGASNKVHTVIVRGKPIVIKGGTVTGGRDGIHLAGANAVIADTIIRNAGLNGIFVDHHSFARILDTRIEGNRGAGIVIDENSVARVGFTIPRAEDLSPNTIQNNGLDGIVVQRSSTAWIAGNIVRGNKLNGIVVDRHSQATIGGNVIDDNGGDAIVVSRLSGLTLGSMGARRDGPNSTKRNNNGVGIRCFMGGYVDGSAGTLNGAKGERHFENTCIDGLTATK
ncbi:MAG: right-handed parallel beta-helix repeat-containing protein [Methyloceanibacter sp.]